jgi:hypothetical protein
VNLFQLGDFVLHDGRYSRFKIECDALAAGDWDALAVMLLDALPFRYGEVEGVPSGGYPLAGRMRQWSKPGERLLIVDDVLTSGGSMEQQRAGREAIGGVAFSRGVCPSWVTPLFQMKSVYQ